MVGTQEGGHNTLDPVRGPGGALIPQVKAQKPGLTLRRWPLCPPPPAQSVPRILTVGDGAATGQSGVQPLAPDSP